MFFTLGSSTPTSRHVSMPPPGYPHTNSLPSEGHVVSQPNTDVPVTLAAAIAMSSAPNSINGFTGNLPPSITLHNMGVPCSPGFLNGATCKIKHLCVHDFSSIILFGHHYKLHLLLVPCICSVHLAMVREPLISQGWCPLIQRWFSVVYDYMRKEDLRVSHTFFFDKPLFWKNALHCCAF